MSRRPTVFAAAVLAALALAACGGEDDDDAGLTPTTETSADLSKAELIEQGDETCAEVNAAIASVDASSTDIAGELSQTSDLYSGMVERLKGLGATVVGRVDEEGSFWTVMQDPEGNELCVLRGPEDGWPGYAEA